MWEGVAVSNYKTNLLSKQGIDLNTATISGSHTAFITAAVIAGIAILGSVLKIKVPR